MSVQILSVELGPESIEAVAQRVAQLLQQGVQQPPTQYVQGPTGAAPAAAQPAHAAPGTAAPAAHPGTAAPGPSAAAPPADYDPWQGTGATQAPPQQPVQPYQAQPPQAPQQAPQGGPVCLHGPMRYVPGGFSRSTNRPYPAFYGCPQPKDAPDKCKSVPA